MQLFILSCNLFTSCFTFGKQLPVYTSSSFRATFSFITVLSIWQNKSNIHSSLCYLVSTSCWAKSLSLANASFVSVLFGAGQVMTTEGFYSFITDKSCLLKLGSDVVWLKQNSKTVGHKTKSVTCKTWKCFIYSKIIIPKPLTLCNLNTCKFPMQFYCIKSS